MKNNKVLLFSLIVLMNSLCSYAILKTRFIEDLCVLKERTTIDLRFENAGILMSEPRLYDTDFFKCEITLMSYPKSSVVLSIYSYDISSEEQLTIQESDKHTIALIGSATFKDERKSITSRERLVISYSRKNSSSSAKQSRRSGFQFTFTLAHESPCMSNEFPCKNGKCILKELVCNGHNHCGDRSDQIKCVPESQVNREPDVIKVRSYSSLAVILISVMAVMLLIISVSFIAVIIKFARVKKQHNADNTEAEQSSGNAPLQTVSSTLPTGDIQRPSASETQRSSEEPERETIYSRLCRSIREPRTTPRVEEVPVHRETYQVPSMYPNLDQAPTAPELRGAENPSFQNEE